jgi:hypothetical protein
MLIVILLGVMLFFRKPILENLGSRVLRTKVEISSIDVIPYKLALKLNGIKVPKEKLFIQDGMLYVIPLKLVLYGAKVGNSINLQRENFIIRIYRKWGWKFDVFLKGIDIKKFDNGFKSGVLNGYVNGKYKRQLDFCGTIVLKNIVLSDLQDEYFGIAATDVKEIIKNNQDKIEIDFLYNGPISDIRNLTRYRPGQKTVQLIKSFILKKIF